MDAVAVANGEAGEALVFLIPWGYLFPRLFLEPFQPLVKVSDSFGILLLLLVVDPVSLPDGLYKGLGEVAEPDWVVDVEALNEVACQCRGDRVGAGDVEVRDRHEDCCGSARGAIWGHGNVSIGGSEWKGFG